MTNGKHRKAADGPLRATKRLSEQRFDLANYANVMAKFRRERTEREQQVDADAAQPWQMPKSNPNDTTWSDQWNARWRSNG